MGKRGHEVRSDHKQRQLRENEMKIKKQPLVLAALLGAGMIFSSCGSAAKNTDAEIWTAPAVEKILQDREYDLGQYGDTVSVFAAKGEYEGAQIILTPEADSEYDLTLSDLSTAGGDIFQAENILAYHQKYIDVVATGLEYYTQNGMYPDALVPFDAAKRAGETRIEGGNNQGIYLSFNVPLSQKAGVYTGDIAVKCGGKEFFVPVSLEVWNFSVSEETHAKSIFLNEWDFGAGELNTTDAMYQAYNKALVEYRLAPNVLLYNNKHTDADIALYTELAYEYAKMPRCPNIVIPYEVSYKQISSVVEGEETLREEQSFDTEIFKKYIKSFVKKSAETGVDILAKCVVYFRHIDEPQLWKLQERVKLICTDLAAAKEEIASEVESDETLGAQERSVYAREIRALPNVVTSDYDAQYDGYDLIYCPEFQYYDGVSLRENYADQSERWWYGCVNPNYPYPTYHIDDHLLSARVLSWMQAEYDVIGNLYWATDAYSVDGKMPEDFYSEAIHNSATNGEGFLFYPGAKYGIFGPVGTLRLEAIRDGIEEFEMMYALKERYEELAGETEAFGAQSVIEYMGSNLYDGTRWATSTQQFYETRAILADLSMLAFSSAGICIAGVDKTGYEFTLKVYVREGEAPLANGREATASQPCGQGTLYTYTADLREEHGDFVLTAQADGKEYSVRFDLGGEITALPAESLTDSFAPYNDSAVTISLTDAASVGAFEEGNLLRLALAETDGEAAVLFENELLNRIGVGTKSIEFGIYSDVSAEYEISFLYQKGATVAGRPIYKSVARGNIERGYNRVAVNNLHNYSWDKYGGIERAMITFRYAEDTAIDVYVREILVYGV